MLEISIPLDAPVTPIETNQTSDSLGFVLGHRETSKFYVSQYIKNRTISWDAFEKEDLSEEVWNISRMLPGGIKVLGLYVISKENTFSNLPRLSLLSKTLKRLTNQGEDDEFFPAIEERCTQNVLVHVNPTNSSMVCKVFDEVGKVWREMKVKRESIEWRLICGNCLIEQTIGMGRKLSSEEISKTIERKLHEQVAKMVVVLRDANGAYISKELKQSLSKEIEASFYVTSAKETNVNQLVSDGACLFSGTFPCIAYLPAECKYEAAERALKSDLMLFFQTCLFSYSNSNGESMELPRRVAIKTNSPMDFSDYLYPREDINTILSQCQEVLGISVTNEQLVDLSPVKKECEDAVNFKKSSFLIYPPTWIILIIAFLIGYFVILQR